jgi:hypothetical protein
VKYNRLFIINNGMDSSSPTFGIYVPDWICWRPVMKRGGAQHGNYSSRCRSGKKCFSSSRR